MAYDFERREIRVLHAGGKKTPTSVSISDPIMDMIDAIAAFGVMSRSEAIEVAIYRLHHSHQMKMKKDFSDKMEEDSEPEAQSKITE